MHRATALVFALFFTSLVAAAPVAPVSAVSSSSISDVATTATASSAADIAAPLADAILPAVAVNEQTGRVVVASVAATLERARISIGDISIHIYPNDPSYTHDMTPLDAVSYDHIDLLTE
ncbi:hypothetical protein FB451DRAFT_1401278 [Mycena latifolia]|nr:hypothetical protein FB451DRAFT_1401278 [Mycena latifolia]